MAASLIQVYDLVANFPPRELNKTLDLRTKLSVYFLNIGPTGQFAIWDGKFSEINYLSHEITYFDNLLKKQNTDLTHRLNGF